MKCVKGSKGTFDMLVERWRLFIIVSVLSLSLLGSQGKRLYNATSPMNIHYPVSGKYGFEKCSSI